jgi:preprotein translocase subunit YajC
MFDLEVLTFTLAQQPVPVTPEVGGSSGTPAGTTAPGGNGGGAAPTGPAPGGDLMLLFVVLIVAMLVFTMWSSRRDRKKREAMVNAVKKHDRVQTIGGVIGSVVEVKSDTVVRSPTVITRIPYNGRAFAERAPRKGRCRLDNAVEQAVGQISSSPGTQSATASWPGVLLGTRAPNRTAQLGLREGMGNSASATRWRTRRGIGRAITLYHRARSSSPTHH